MNLEDLKKIGNSIGITLPDYYKSTMLNYPFPKDSFADEFMLVNNPGAVIENNDKSLIEAIDKGVKPFSIGSDGGEELYYVDLNKEKSEVFVYYLETQKSEIQSKTWNDYLEDIKKTLKEIEEDEKAMEERKKNKNWWQFWI